MSKASPNSDIIRALDHAALKLESRVAALEDWRRETTELVELRKRVANQEATIISLQQQLMNEQKHRVEAELRADR